jgi:hypothetical protein
MADEDEALLGALAEDVSANVTYSTVMVDPASYKEISYAQRAGEGVPVTSVVCAQIHGGTTYVFAVVESVCAGECAKDVQSRVTQCVGALWPDVVASLHADAPGGRPSLPAIARALADVESELVRRVGTDSAGVSFAAHCGAALTSFVWTVDAPQAWVVNLGAPCTVVYDVVGGVLRRVFDTTTSGGVCPAGDVLYEVLGCTDAKRAAGVAELRPFAWEVALPSGAENSFFVAQTTSNVRDIFPNVHALYGFLLYRCPSAKLRDAADCLVRYAEKRLGAAADVTVLLARFEMDDV